MGSVQQLDTELILALKRLLYIEVLIKVLKIGGFFMNISVAMTTFNGEKYLHSQLNSILIQLGNDDEVIICDDGSTDETIKIIENYISEDNRISLFKNKRKGVVLNFEDAISKCNNELIFLSDQDDIWNREKVNVIKAAFRHGNETLILHNAIDFYENTNEENILIHKMKHGLIRNIIKSCYWGCCMAFKKELVKDILPFPQDLVAHDQWIGIIAESKKESKFVNESLIKHRRHDKNVTKRLPFNKKISFRFNLSKCYLKFYKR